MIFTPINRCETEKPPRVEMKKETDFTMQNGGDFAKSAYIKSFLSFTLSETYVDLFYSVTLACNEKIKDVRHQPNMNTHYPYKRKE